MEKRFALQMVLLVIIALGAVALGFNQNFITYLTRSLNLTPSPTQISSETKILRIFDASNQEKARINIAIADSDEEKRLGLGATEKLATDSGMLFLYNQSGKYTYWMKGLEYPLDFIWIQDETVADLLADVPPPQPGVPDSDLPRYTSKVPVNRVLEVNSGYIATKNIQVGDKVIIEDRPLQTMPETQPSVEIIIVE